MKKNYLLVTLIMASLLTACTSLSNDNTAEAEDISTDEISSEVENEIATDTSSDLSSEDLSSDLASTAESSDASSSDSSVDLSDDQFVYNGKTISVLDDAAKLMDTLGTPYEKEPFSSQPDRIDYRYGSEDKLVELNIAVIDGKDYPFSITIRDSNVKTAKGIGVGSKKDDVIAAYGEPTKSFDEGAFFMVYDLGKTELTFTFFDGDEVGSFDYINTDTRSKYTY